MPGFYRRPNHPRPLHGQRHYWCCSGSNGPGLHRHRARKSILTSPAAASRKPIDNPGSLKSLCRNPFKRRWRYDRHPPNRTPRKAAVVVGAGRRPGARRPRHSALRRSETDGVRRCCGRGNFMLRPHRPGRRCWSPLLHGGVRGASLPATLSARATVSPTLHQGAGPRQFYAAFVSFAFNVGLPLSAAQPW